MSSPLKQQAIRSDKPQANGSHTLHLNNDLNYENVGLLNGECSRRMTSYSSNDAVRFLENVFRLLTEAKVITGPADHPDKVIEFRHPRELQKLIECEIKEDLTDDEQLLRLCKDAIKYSVKTGHPHFFNQLYGGLDRYSLAGSWITEALNTSMATFEIAPVFTVVEHAIIQKILQKIGFENGDGIFSPGGSMSNMYGLQVARYKMFPEIKTEGVRGLPQMIAFASEDAHYSITKSSSWLGIGTKNVHQIPTDSRGKMIPEELEKAVIKAKGKNTQPFFVCATSGTTVLGSFDPIEPIADICERHGLWLHVDACWGGGALLSNKYRCLVKGIERADSVAWNPHKMFGAPLQCAAFLLKEKGLLHHCNCSGASYIFQQDKFYDMSFDTGDKSIQCGRKSDAFKLWLMWKARGDEMSGAIIDRAIDNSKYLAEKIQSTKGFQLVLPEFEYANVCFWYIPKTLQGKNGSQDYNEKLGKVAPKIKERMISEGTMMIGYQPLKSQNFPNFFRMVVPSTPFRGKEEMDFVVSEIKRLGDDL